MIPSVVYVKADSIAPASNSNVYDEDQANCTFPVIHSRIHYTSPKKLNLYTCESHGHWSIEYCNSVGLSQPTYSTIICQKKKKITYR